MASQLRVLEHARYTGWGTYSKGYSAHPTADSLAPLGHSMAMGVLAGYSWVLEMYSSCRRPSRVQKG